MRALKPPETPKRRRHEAAASGSRKEAIIEAGVEIFGTVPYDEVSISKIAGRAGVAHGLLFHYFKNKRGLYLAVLRRVAADLQQVHAPPSDAASPGQRVRVIINQHFDYIERHPETLLAFLRGGVGADSEARQIIEETRWDGIRFVLDVMGIESPGPTIKMAMRGWSGFLDEAMIYRSVHEAQVSRAHMVEMGVEVLVAALIAARGHDTVTGIDPREILAG